MLVLTRKSDQKIHSGDNIVITIVRIQGDQVFIRINAPKNREIVREELLDNPIKKQRPQISKT